MDGSTYLDTRFDEVETHRERFAHEDVWVMGSLEGLLQFLQLPPIEVGARSTPLRRTARLAPAPSGATPATTDARRAASAATAGRVVTLVGHHARVAVRARRVTMGIRIAVGFVEVADMVAVVDRGAVVVAVLEGEVVIVARVAVRQARAGSERRDEAGGGSGVRVKQAVNGVGRGGRLCEVLVMAMLRVKVVRVREAVGRDGRPEVGERSWDGAAEARQHAGRAAKVRGRGD